MVLLPTKESLLSESYEAGGGTQRGGSQEPMGKQAKQASEDPGLWSETASFQLVEDFFYSWLGQVWHSGIECRLKWTQSGQTQESRPGSGSSGV